MKNHLKLVAFAVLCVAGSQLSIAQDLGCYGGYNGFGGPRARSSFYSPYGNFGSPGLHLGIGGFSSHYRGRGHVHHHVNPNIHPGRGHYDWHDTSHFHYNPGRIVRHGNHYHVLPGYHSLHRTGHWDLHHR